MSDDCCRRVQEEIIVDKEHVDEVNSPLNRDSTESLRNSAPSENIENSLNEGTGAAHEVPNTAELPNGLETPQVSIPPVVSS